MDVLPTCYLAFFSGMPGTGEILVLFVVVLLLFGPKKLPEIARMIGRTLDSLRNASQDFKDEIMKIEDTVKKDVKDVVAGTIEGEAEEYLDDESYGDYDPDDPYSDPYLNTDGDGAYGYDYETELENENPETKKEDLPDSETAFSDDDSGDDKKDASLDSKEGGEDGEKDKELAG